MDFEDRLKNRMEGYRYGRYNFLENNFDILSLEFGVYIKNFYDKTFSKIGDCKDLSETYFRENLDLNLIRVIGREPLFFFGKKATHFYLLNFENELCEKFWNLSLNSKKKFVEKQNPLIVDPSFKKVEHFLGSKYEIFGFYNQPFSKESDLILSSFSDNAIPLGLVNDEELAIISYLDGELGIILQKRESFEGIFYKFDSEKLFKKVSKNKDLINIIQNISKKYNSLNIENYFTREMKFQKKLIPDSKEIFCEYQNYD